jgi:hypothetical protein
MSFKLDPFSSEFDAHHLDVVIKTSWSYRSVTGSNETGLNRLKATVVAWSAKVWFAILCYRSVSLVARKSGRCGVRGNIRLCGRTRCLTRSSRMTPIDSKATLCRY